MQFLHQDETHLIEYVQQSPYQVSKPIIYHSIIRLRYFNFLTASSKLTLKKIGLTILTMASVYLMMNKCQDAETTQIINPKTQTKSNIQEWSIQNDLEPKIIKKINCSSLIETNQTEITDTLSSQMRFVQNQMKQFINQNYSWELDIRQFSDKKNLIKIISNMEIDKDIEFESVPVQQKNFEEP